MFLLLYVFQKVIFRGFKTKQRGKSTFFEKLDPIGRFRSGTCAVLIFELNLTNNVCLLYMKMTLELVLKKQNMILLRRSFWYSFGIYLPAVMLTVKLIFWQIATRWCFFNLQTVLVSLKARFLSQLPVRTKNANISRWQCGDVGVDGVLWNIDIWAVLSYYLTFIICYNLVIYDMFW